MTAKSTKAFQNAGGQYGNTIDFSQSTLDKSKTTIQGLSNQQDPAFNNTLKGVPSAAVLQSLQDQSSSHKQSLGNDESVILNNRYMVHHQNDSGSGPMTADKMTQQLNGSNQVITFTSSIIQNHS